jgi:hypothetical protein
MIRVRFTADADASTRGYRLERSAVESARDHAPGVWIGCVDAKDPPGARCVCISAVSVSARDWIEVLECWDGKSPGLITEFMVSASG